MFSLTLVGVDQPATRAAADRIDGKADWLGLNAADFIIEADAPIDYLRDETIASIDGLPVDVCVQPMQGRRKRLFVADMDSTIIGCECLDELADFAGLKAEISAITERAMRGEIEFEGALRERVGKLKGLATDALQKAYDERVRLNPGARTLVQTMAANGTRCVLVSGGFTFFTAKVADAAGFHANRANRLAFENDALTGAVEEPILGKQAKLDALHEEAAALSVPLSETLAIGDGANDLSMIQAAGLGIAYRAKPIVAAQADCRLDHADLT
ncbi:MAG TPA: phosphoserine phosphatase SerB, partial [Caulobacteraceae bacterium]|nr:phosphoserine phosphatase SerB [Caulobacteraceae bacterium]